MNKLNQSKFESLNSINRLKSTPNRNDSHINDDMNKIKNQE